jgi:hypothetical protein
MLGAEPMNVTFSLAAEGAAEPLHSVCKITRIAKRMDVQRQHGAVGLTEVVFASFP